MEKSDVTEIIFKKAKDGEIIAFLPYETASYGNMLSYVHVGQHGEACLDFYHGCKKAKSEEYKELYDELLMMGYEIKIIQKINYDRFFLNKIFV